MHVHLGPVSNRKIHCYLIVLVVCVLIFLSLTLLMIYSANSNWQDLHREDSNPDELKKPNLNPSESQESTSSSQSFNESSQLTSIEMLENESNSTIIAPSTPATNATITAITMTTTVPSNLRDYSVTNCSQVAIDANLTLALNFQCPIGTFPCHSCPDICVEQRRNCDGTADCPDRSDESSSNCHDSNGAVGVIFQNIVNRVRTNKKQNLNNSSQARPESCPQNLFESDQCPCVLIDPLVVICERVGLTRVPSTLLSSVYKIRMNYNSIESIDNVIWPKSLTSLVMVDNSLSHIGASTFETAPKLSKLYLGNNRIEYIDPDAFKGLSSLTTVQIEHNKLTTFESLSFCRYATSVTKLYLTENSIDLPESTRFEECLNLRELILDNNKISVVRSHWFSNVTSLIWLSLAHNQITHIEPGAFNWDYELEELNLSFNKITVVTRQTFYHNLNIGQLHLDGNPLSTIPVDAFREVVQLKSLRLKVDDLDHIELGTFSYLTQLKFIYFSKFRYCHYATHVRVCRPLTDGLSSSEELLAFPILKYAVWIVALVCSLGNVFVFVWRSISPHEDRSLSLFVRNLSIADLMMGVYLSVIGWQDWKFQHNFGHHAIEWMSSWTCTGIGFLATLSSELSVFILTIITIERYKCIVTIQNQEKNAQRRRARVLVTLAWLLSFSLALYPLLQWPSSNRSDYYTTNGLCLPLHIDQPFSHGWLYSAFIYIGINFSAVVVIIVLYIHMYTMIIDSRQSSRPVSIKEEKREDAILAVRFFFIVITDCLCWIPIVVIKVMALARYSISPSIYGWLVVFVIPINSALNPIIYTLAAPTSIRDSVRRLMERMCYKINSMTSSDNQYPSKLSTATDESIQGYPSTSTASTSITIDLSNSLFIFGKNRRKKTGSCSTTCDTFETSIASHSQSKSSAESSLLFSRNGSSRSNSNSSKQFTIVSTNYQAPNKLSSELT